MSGEAAMVLAGTLHADLIAEERALFHELKRESPSPEITAERIASMKSASIRKWQDR